MARSQILRQWDSWVWAGWLAALAALCYGLLAGRSASGGIHVDASGTLLTLFALPTVLFSGWSARRPAGAKLAVWAGWGIAAVALWWVYWLPATLVDMATSTRYGANSRGIPLPASAFVQMGVVCLATWLLSLRHDDGKAGRGVWHQAVVWLIMTGAALSLAETAAGWAISQQALAFAGPAVAATAWGMHRGLAHAPRPLVRFALGLLASQALLVSLWAALYHWGDRLPQSLNQFGPAFVF